MPTYLSAILTITVVISMYIGLCFGFKDFKENMKYIISVIKEKEQEDYV